MDFTHPQMLWALAALPLIVIWLARETRRARADLGLFAGERLQESLAPGYSWRKNLLKGTLKVVALGLLITALAGPRFGKALVKVEREGIDVVIALDTSLSMMAEDMLPNRLERAKHEIIDLIRGLHGDRVGLVVFAGDAFALCPLTVDYDAALMFARSVDVYIVSEPGTAIDKALETSVALFDKNSDRDAAIILVTDGENHEGDPMKAAGEAKSRNIRVFTIGIGDPRGELIPERENDGSIAGYKKDKRGETVLTQLDEVTLQQIAAATGGKYLPATREGLELKVLYNEISGMNRQLIKGEFVERRKERYNLFLAAALFLLALDMLIGARATGLSRRRTRWLHTGISSSVLAVLFALLAPGNAAARHVDGGKVKDGNERYHTEDYKGAFQAYQSALGDTIRLPKHYQGVFYNQGNALYMEKRYDEAIKRYQKSYSEDSTLTGRMLYNRGNAMVKAGNVDAAIESYIQALGIMPDDEASRHNLEFALRLKQQQQQQQQQQQKGDNQDQQNQDEQNQQQNQDQQQQEQDQSQQQNQDQQQQQDQQQDDQQQQDPQQKPEDQSSQADSSQVPPPQADSTQIQPPQLTPEEMTKLSKEDAMRILQALAEQERKLQMERRRAAFRRLKRSGKDW